jgi:uncharacterized protein (TIGR02284 family)
MTNQQEKVIKTLNRLADICEDGNRGYKDASEHIEHDDIKTILYRLSQQRALFEAELKNEITKLGGHTDGKEEDSGSILGTLHRRWIDVKEKFSSKDYEAILNECQRGDKAAVEAYEKALKEDLPEYIKEMVTNQFKLIKGALTQLQEFKVNPS